MKRYPRFSLMLMMLGLMLFATACGTNQYLVSAGPHTPSTVLQYQQSVEVQYHTVVQNLDQAIQSEEVVISMDPQYGDAYLRLGGLFLIAGQQQASIEAIRKAITLQPGDASNWVVLGQVQAEMKSTSAAKVAFDKAIAINPGSWEAWDGLGFLAVLAHRDVLGWQDSEKAILVAGEQGPTLDLMGRVLYDEGDAADALRYFKSSSHIQPDWWQSYYDQGRADVVLGNINGALTELRDALNLDPTNGQVWTMLTRIESNKESMDAQGADGTDS